MTFYCDESRPKCNLLYWLTPVTLWSNNQVSHLDRVVVGHCFLPEQISRVPLERAKKNETDMNAALMQTSVCRVLWRAALMLKDANPMRQHKGFSNVLYSSCARSNDRATKDVSTCSTQYTSCFIIVELSTKKKRHLKKKQPHMVPSFSAI